MTDQADEELQRLLREPDPLRQATLAHHMLVATKRREAVIAAVRAAAINRTHTERGMTFAAIAAELKLSPGRISQIRKGLQSPLQ